MIKSAIQNELNLFGRLRGVERGQEKGVRKTAEETYSAIFSTYSSVQLRYHLTTVWLRDTTSASGWHIPCWLCSFHGRDCVEIALKL